MFAHDAFWISDEVLLIAKLEIGTSFCNRRCDFFSQASQSLIIFPLPERQVTAIAIKLGHVCLGIGRYPHAEAGGPAPG
jgi:hypothetical protein